MFDQFDSNSYFLLDMWRAKKQIIIIVVYNVKIGKDKEHFILDPKMTTQEKIRFKYLKTKFLIS